MARKANHGRRKNNREVRINGAVVKMTSNGELEIQLRKIEKFLAARIPGIVIARTQKGLDANGQTFRAYSSEYAKLRAAAGRNPGANLWLTGGMVSSFAKRRATFTGEALNIHFAPDASRSTALTLTKSGAVQGSTVDENGVSAPKISPAHNLLGHWHHTGAGKLPKRKWLGLSKMERRRLADEISRISGFWRLRK